MARRPSVSDPRARLLAVALAAFVGIGCQAVVEFDRDLIPGGDGGAGGEAGLGGDAGGALVGGGGVAGGNGLADAAEELEP